MKTAGSNKQYSILLLDDDSLVVNSLARVLRYNKYDVSICRDPIAAVSLCEKMQFDLIITDQRMPIMTGIEFASKVRLQQPGARIVLISGYNDYVPVIEAFNSETIHRFVFKPWSNDVFVDIVQEQLEVATEGIWVRNGADFLKDDSD
ncbi:MAG: response regulator RpfG family c-di-GMP phosphodiesterase [Candidatus Azotimanducaceae bacterium]|jgi:response regulator RpfG family c-di-GMP phosphodiesterase